MEFSEAYNSHNSEPLRDISISSQIYDRLDFIVEWINSIGPDFTYSILGIETLTVDSLVEATLIKQLNSFDPSKHVETDETISTSRSNTRINISISVSTYEHLQLWLQLLNTYPRKDEAFSNLPQEHIIEKLMQGMLQSFMRALLQNDS